MQVALEGTERVVGQVETANDSCVCCDLWYGALLQPSPSRRESREWRRQFPLSDRDAAHFARCGFVVVPKAVAAHLLRSAVAELDRCAGAWGRHVKRPDDWRMHFMATWLSGAM